METDPGPCYVCRVEKNGCCCDGAYDPNGCFKCSPKEHRRPLCSEGCPNYDKNLVASVMER